MTIKFPVSRWHIDAKGFLFKTTEDPLRRRSTLSIKKWRQNSPDQASLCDELGLDCVVLWQKSLGHWVKIMFHEYIL